MTSTPSATPGTDLETLRAKPCSECGCPRRLHDHESGCHDEDCRCTWWYYPDEGGMVEGESAPVTRQAIALAREAFGRAWRKKDTHVAQGETMDDAWRLFCADHGIEPGGAAL